MKNDLLEEGRAVHEASLVCRRSFVIVGCYNVGWVVGSGGTPVEIVVGPAKQGRGKTSNECEYNLEPLTSQDLLIRGSAGCYLSYPCSIAPTVVDASAVSVNRGEHSCTCKSKVACQRT